MSFSGKNCNLNGNFCKFKTYMFAHELQLSHHSYSQTRLIPTQLLRIPGYFKLKTISLGFFLQPFTLGHFELLLFRKIFSSPVRVWNSGVPLFSNVDSLQTLLHLIIPSHSVIHKGEQNQVTSLTRFWTELWYFAWKYQTQIPKAFRSHRLNSWKAWN